MTTSDPPLSALQPRRILVRGVNWLGDAVMTTPALLRLREWFPQAHIALLTPEKLAGLWLHHPAIDEVKTFRPKEGLLSVAAKLRGAGAPEGFVRPDLALVLPNSPRSALEVWLARIPRRVGYMRPWRNWFLTEAVPQRPGRAVMRKLAPNQVKQRIRRPAANKPREDNRGGAMSAEEAQSAPSSALIASNSPAANLPQPPDPSQAIEARSAAHQIHEYLYLVSALGAKPEPLPPQLVVADTEVRDADQTFLEALRDKGKDRPPGKPLLLLGLNPGAEYGPAKRWPAENFAAVVREISRRIPECAWLLFGGANDAKLCGAIEAQAANAPTLNLAGKTSLRELMALLKLCRVLLTNDTGPMHVAAALGTPVVVPFGSTSPELTGPGLPGDTRHRLIKSDAPCSPCFRRTCPIDFRCMTGIAVPGVVEAVLQAGELV